MQKSQPRWSSWRSLRDIFTYEHAHNTPSFIPALLYVNALELIMKLDAFQPAEKRTTQRTAKKFCMMIALSSRTYTYSHECTTTSVGAFV